MDLINLNVVYTIAIPLLAVAILLLILNELHKRGDKLEVKMVKEYTWNRCFDDGKQGIIILKLEMISKKKKPFIIRDSGLEVIRDFKMPSSSDHVPTIERVDDTNFNPKEFLFSEKTLKFDHKGHSIIGFDVFLSNDIPKRGKRLVVEYCWFDEKWRKNSRRFTIYIDRSEKQVVL